MTKRSEADWTRLQQSFLLYLQGDAQTARSLFEEISKILKAFFAVRIPSSPEADDLTQMALLKIHFAREKFNPSLTLKTWVFTIARNSLIDHWRGGDQETESLEDHEEAHGVPSGELDPALLFQLKTDLNQALLTLKPNDRTIVYLYGVEGFSMAEIAETLKTTEAAVKVRAHRCYKEMRKLL